MVNLRISLNPNEADALAKLACSELRDPPDQIRLIVRRELERLGLLTASSIPTIHKTEAAREHA